MDADIIVIGASPAGLMAARNASRKGAKVLVVDKKEIIGYPTHPANTFFKGMFDRSQEPVDQSYVMKNMKGAYLIAPSGGRVAIESPAYFLDRLKFDEYYAKQSMDAGAEVRMGVEVSSVFRSNGAMNLSTSDGVLSCSLVIVSDGINSKMAGLLGLEPMKHPNDIAWAMEAFVEAEGIGEPDMFEYYVGNHCPGWKSTYSPCGGNLATLGVYVRGHGKDVSPFFERWVEKFKQIKGLDELTVLERSVGGDPIITIPKQMLADGVMLVGGAAGQSGIGYSMHAGQMCGDVAADAIAKGNVSAKFLSEYRKRWNAEYRAEYVLGRIGLETLRKMTDPEIDDLMKTFEGVDFSFLSGTSFHRSMQLGLFMLKKNPKSLLAYRALLRNK
ncbi:NAD(P)/FAD-dependent oxidoreductase [Methanococcoides sp. AM1]|uniref:NAD(P)/FAD-dependent oxidoreductase n=1 Tax=Methanococcoides sp. AM1 TaxID=1201011 RepID=UPI0010830B9A|nr:NAD(P)/FAD-dependent oxidoreductase [Methanococcoides sp. AM1]